MSSIEKTLIDLGLTPSKAFDGKVSGLCIDSRVAKEGCLFAALPGTQIHGARFLAQALERGAKAVLTDQEGFQIAHELSLQDGACYVIVQDPHAALAAACALWFEKQPSTMVAVTGTNGKTSVSSFCRQIWTELGLDAVNLGTTGVEGAFSAPLAHTTPDPITLQKLLYNCASAGVTHGAMEASSHGLAQRRLDGVRLKAAGFTNFTQDHLDYHTSFEAYFDAKAGLFNRVLPPTGVAVINIDDPKLAPFAERLRKEGQKTITVGRSVDADLRLLAQKYDPAGQTIRFSYDGKTHQSFLPLIGGFQGENVLMAAALCIATGQEAHGVFEVLRELKTVRGRMEHAATRANGATVFVDYAHTPDAVETAVNAYRPHVMGRLIAIIGAGGDRDPTKRPLMGAAAAQSADYVVVTDDNPRSEDPKHIRNMVLEGTRDQDHVIEIGDRAEAILRAIDMLETGDGLLITGKGHETGQIIGDDVLPFNDVEQASVAVAALDGVL